MLETTLIGLLSHSAVLVPALLATFASCQLASLWADAINNHQRRSCEQC